MEINLAQKNACFECIFCDFKCCKKCDWLRHVKTKKHIYGVNGNKMESAEMKKNAEYACKCGKQFLTNSGLWKHKNKCVTNDARENNDKDLIMILINENKDFKQLMLEMCKEKDEYKTMMLKVIENGTNNTNCNNTNSNNKTFNLQFFLNETCKDAMNIMDFVDSIKLQLSDLENVGKMGFVDGISNIIVKSLNSLDETKRPVHCTDTKREVMYVKDEDKWEKENDSKPKIRKLIKHVTHKNTKLIKDFKAKYPGCEKSESKYSNSYDKLVIEAFGGKGDNDEEKENKIIKKISNVTTIDKNV